MRPVEGYQHHEHCWLLLGMFRSTQCSVGGKNTRAKTRKWTAGEMGRENSSRTLMDLDRPRH